MQALAEEDRPTAFDATFSIGDMVLAFHGTLLYEGRIVAIGDEVRDRPEAYTVHFQGWKKSWDEKVPSENVFEHNDDNLRIAHRLLHGAKMRQQASQPVQSENDALSTPAALPDDSPLNAMFQIPPPLQRQLVDDWEFVTKERRLVPLPRDPNVQDVLHKWVNARRQSTDKAAREVAEGIQTFFDASLSKLLLYRFERQQYNEYFHTGTQRDETLLPSAVYGPEHLLRLLLKLPYLLESTEMDKGTIETIAEKANEFAKYLQKNGRSLFISEYVPASEEYLTSLQSAAEDG